MKIALLNRLNNDKNDIVKKKTWEEWFEGLLFKAFMIVFIIMLFVQTASFNTSVQSTVLHNYNIEGEPLKEEVYLFVPCKMELKLTNIESCQDLKVLVNGVERESFTGKTVLLDLKDGDIVELDASYILVMANVQISAVSKNISGLLGKTVSVTDGIVLVARVKTIK